MTPKSPATIVRWSQWQDVKPQSVSSRIVDQVRAALFRREIKPGDLLGSETDLARRFGVSRVPVRDAFKALQALGIIEVKMGSNGGARVASGDPSRFADALAVQLQLVGIAADELLEAQLAIEMMATELAAKRATREDIDALRAILAELQTIAAKPLTSATARRFTEVAMQFHVALIDAAHNRALSAQFKALLLVLEPVYARRSSEVIVRRVVSTNRRVLDAVEGGNAERACSLVRRRLEIVRARQSVKAVKK
ncbi:MAG TPA: FCD domain-containing protein [Stellaceae bacterium]